MSNKIKAEAISLGFSLFGIALPTKPLFFDQFYTWVKKKQYGEMKYLANPTTMHLRKNPCLMLSGCKSIIILGYPYPGVETITKANHLGSISSYALSEDYHKTIKRLHKKLISRIGEMLPGVSISHTSAVDSAPVLEKNLAQSAGLGWIGKNGCLINPLFGSFFFLSEIFSTLALPPTHGIIDDGCGKCSRCIDSCPTRCIQPDRTLDAARCISYLSIEHKGEIPHRLRQLMGNRIFGCDVCQGVCPWNQKVMLSKQEHEKGEFSINPTPVLVEALTKSEHEFTKEYGHTPIQRTGYKRFMRNVIIAVGNSRDQNCVSSLGQLMLKNPEAQLRSEILWALGKMKTTQARQVLELAYSSEIDDSIKQKIQKLLDGD